MRKIKKLIYDHLGSLYQRIGWGAPFHGAWISNTTLRVAPGSLLPFFFGSFERTEWRLAKPFAHRVDAIVDVGAGTGALSVALARRAKRNIEHIAVEANPALLESIRKNAILNNRKIEVINAAISYDDCPWVDLNTGASFLQSSIFIRSQHTNAIRTPAATLESIFNAYISDDISNALLVMDIEGGEVDVLENDLGVIARYVSYLVIEFHPATRGGQGVVDWAVEVLGKLNYIPEGRLGNTIQFSRKSD